MRNRYIISICFSLIISLNVLAQNTYTWNVSRGDWGTASSWTPSRTAPASNDILIFDGSQTPNACATGVTTQTIGKLRIINNANVRFIGKSAITGVGTISRSATSVTGVGTQFLTDLKVGDIVTSGTTFVGEVASISNATTMVVSASGTLNNVAYAYAPSLNVNDGSNTALDITSGSTLTMSDSALVIRILSGSKGQVNGLVRMLNARQRIVSIDSLSLFIGSTGIIRTDSSFVGNAFSQIGGQNTVVFQSGSSYEFYIGSNPFGLTAPASKVYFAPGSNYVHLSSSLPSISGRSMANFKYNTASTLTATQNATAVFDSIVVQQGQFTISSAGTNTIGSIIITNGVFGINQTAGSSNITGNLSVASGGKLLLQGKFTTSPANICFRGTTPQVISGLGEFRIANTADSAVRFRIQNPFGVSLQRNLDLNSAYLDLDSGFINLNSNTLSIGASALQARASQLNGYVKGPGNLTRWYTTTGVIAGDSSLFPVGGTGGTYPIWVYGTATGAGSVTLSNFTENAGVTTFSSPFSDSALTTGSITVNSRFGHAWTLSSGNGLTGSNFNVRARVNTSSGFITDVTKMRLTLANGVAPGIVSEDGGGTLTQPTAGKLGLTAAQLSNTFYVGTSTASNPLPVLFTSITVQAEDGMNTLNWKTAQEINMNYFLIERLDEGRFVEIARVNATNSKLGATCSYLDAEKGCATYRVVGVDFDGTQNSSELVTSSCMEKSTVSIYPNPVENIVTIQAKEISKLKVYSAYGEEIPVTMQGDKLDLKSLKSGVYYLQVVNHGKVEVVKFIKQ